MKPLSEQDHYEILEVSRDASPEAIERSYRMAHATYSEDSLAGYSVFGSGDSEAIRERIDIAYRVLSDAKARSAYDASLGALSAGEPAPEPKGEAIELTYLPEPSPSAESSAVELPAPLPVDEFESLEDENPEYDGARLRRSRLHRGMELEDISGVTKINPTYLRFIEENRYAELPAPVYVRGFVAAYAECMGLDSKRVARSYMKQFDAATGQSRRGRFLGGR